MTDTLTTPDTIADPRGAPRQEGYRPPPRYRTIVAPPGSMWDGAGSDGDPLTATVRTNLTGGELEWFNFHRDRAVEGNDHEALFRLLVPYVTAWNVRESVFDRETGEVEWRPVPPPAEWDAFDPGRVDVLTFVWLAVQVGRAPTVLSERAEKTSPPSEAPRGGEDSETRRGKPGGPSPTKSRSSRSKRPNCSATPAAST
jgi:hypothetical protein